MYAAFPMSSTSFTEKDCQAGLAENQIQDLDPLISKVSGPHSTLQNTTEAGDIPQRRNLALEFYFSHLELEFGLAEVNIFFHIQHAQKAEKSATRQNDEVSVKSHSATP